MHVFRHNHGGVQIISCAVVIQTVRKHQFSGCIREGLFVEFAKRYEDGVASHLIVR